MKSSQTKTATSANQSCNNSLNPAVIQRRVLDWGALHRRTFPWRKKIPFWQGILVEVLLQRTRADQVVPVFNALRSRFKIAEDLTDITAFEADEIFDSLGLKWRAPLFVELAHTIGQRKGRIKKSYSQLQALPGVGPYAASAALSFHGGVRHSIVDSNTVRVVSRLLGIRFDAETRRKRWISDALDSITPELEFRSFNFGLLDLGAAVCRPRNPSCKICPLMDLCVTGQSLASN